MYEAIRKVTSIDAVSCWTDRFITVGRELRFISLFGTPTRVKTITAIILKEEVVYLHECSSSPNGLGFVRSKRKMKAITRQLARGMTHCLLYVPDYLVPEGEFAEKIFYGDSMDQIHHKFFYAAQKRYSTPFIPAWTEWLWDQMAQTLEINALGFNQVEGIKFLDENDLEERLFEAGSPLSAGDMVVNG
jgi:hypothetical protein